MTEASEDWGFSSCSLIAHSASLCQHASYQIPCIEDASATDQKDLISALSSLRACAQNPIGSSPSEPATGIISTLVVVPAREFQVLGYFSSLTNLEVPVTAQHMREDWSA